ncbi:hypothetical protein C8T65DRAFT_658882 [Cerioporus squamosus]|nr:hypothetical protein C8T65DRAFT_658882 [Cerioporus squamosus]
MATRQNKKRKGRNNAPPRERTVTTLTDGADGPFMSSPVDEHTSASLMSPPFAVSTPIPPVAQPPGISPAPFPIPPFSAPFSYSFSHMPPVAPFQPPQFFPQAIHPQSPVLNHSQPSLPPGQNDLEILERLKETIKSNHHEFFRPVPQPAALASIYLGPKSSSAPSHVPPHPEQVPTDPSPPSLTLTAQDASKLPADAVPAHPSTSPVDVVPPSPDLRDAPRKPPHRLSVSEAPKTNTASPVKRYDSTLNPTTAPPSSKIDRPEASPRMGPPALIGRTGEIAKSPASVPAKIPPPDSKEDLRPRDSSYSRGYDDRDRPSISDSRGPPPRSRSIDRERERERERSRERDHDRDRDRRPDYSRYRDDRRPDDRRPPPPTDRRYDARYTPVRRYDSKASEGSMTGNGRDDRGSEPRPPPRNLGEERAIIRPPVNPPAPPATEDRSTRPPPADDRRAPLSPPGAERRPSDDRRLPPPPDRVDRPDDRRLLPPVDRPEDRRPVPPAVADRADDRRLLPPDDRRRPPSPAGSDRSRRPLPLDDRRAPLPHPPPPRASSVDRSVRPPDDRRPPAPPALARDDRRPPAPPAAPDRSARPAEDRRPPILEERISRAPAPASTDPVPARPLPAEDRSARPAPLEDRSARPVPLEERISRVPSLQERLSYPPPARPDEKAPPRLEERLSRSANQAPSLEERLSNPPASDARPLRPPPDDRPARPPAPVDRPVGRADDRSVLAEPARAPPVAERPPLAPEDRHYAPAGASRFPRPASPAASDRGAPPRSYRASSVVRDEPRSYRPASPARSEYRPAGELRDRVDSRPPYRPEPDRYPADRDRRPDPMDVDPPRFSDRASYRRPSPPPADAYAPPRDRTWVPAGEAPPFRDSDRDRDPPRRPLPGDSHGYSREWREGDRDRPPYGDDYDRSWDRARDYDRDGRFPDRDPAWEAREDRDRRPPYPPLPDVPPAASRAYEPQRPLSSRLSDAYPDDRGYSRDVDRDRARFPPNDPPPFSRVRPRSPSPVRRSTASDDLRPPLKRAREDPYPSGGYYPPGDEPRRPSDFPPPRLRTPPPSGGGYYDDPRYNTSPGAPRDRDFLDRDRDVGYAYDRRGDPRDPPGRLPPPRSPPPYGRPAYDRDDRRYSIPPRP